MKTELYATLASLIQARLNCIKSNNQEWLGKHTARILEIVKAHMPSGSGVDSGTKIDLDASTGEKLVFTFSYHHMNDNGMYDGWTEHKAIVTPSLAHGFSLNITGRNRNQIKEYLHEVFSFAVSAQLDYEIASDSYRIKGEIKSSDSSPNNLCKHGVSKINVCVACLRDKYTSPVSAVDVQAILDQTDWQKYWNDVNEAASKEIEASEQASCRVKKH